VSQPAPPKVIFTTSWDDGHPLDLRIADLLSKHDLPGTFYVPMRNTRPLLPKGAVRDLATRFEVGAHTLNHVDLTSIDDAAARAEIADSKRWVEDTTGRPCTTFCFPMGKFGRRHVAFVHDSGYRGARTVELLSTAPPRRQGGVAILSTTVQAHSHRPGTYFRNIAKRGAFRNLPNLFLHARRSNWLHTAEAILEKVLLHGGVFHLWGHAWEIEEENQWWQLEEVLSLMGRHKHEALRFSCAQLCEHAHAH
jgi:peptidoglycan-N-acetylglucosamine deacetylase